MKGVAETLFVLGTLVAFGLLVAVWAFSTPGALERLLSPSDPSPDPSSRGGGEVAGEEDIYNPESMGQHDGHATGEGHDHVGDGSPADGGGSAPGGAGDSGGGGDGDPGPVGVGGSRGLSPVRSPGIPSLETGGYETPERGINEVLNSTVNNGEFNG